MNSRPETQKAEQPSPEPPTSSEPAPASESLEDLEIRLLLQGIFEHYGYDFRGYAMAMLKRRILARLREEGLASVSELQALVLHDANAFERLVASVTIHVTAMFRDPSFYVAFRTRVVPLLRTYPFLRFWLAGCATGEEVYSLAIVLEEEGLYERCRVYATDVSETTLDRAKAGVFPLSVMKDYTENYQKSGGRTEFSAYYTTAGREALLRPALRRNVVFAQHNLATDASFNSFNVILCRNVLIYFSKPLQDRVHRLLYESLVSLGILAVGSNETVRFSPYEESYEEFDGVDRIYRKKNL